MTNLTTTPMRFVQIGDLGLMFVSTVGAALMVAGIALVSRF